MKLIHRIIVSFGVVIAAACLAAILLFNWSALGWKALAVPTGSMQPHIKSGSIVVVKSVPNSSLKVGDVITYTNPQNKKATITHRIVETRLVGGKIPGYLTKGDANPSADIPIVGGQVQGKVIAAIPYAGTVMAWTHTIIGLLLIIYLPALLVIIREVRRLADYYRQFVPYKAALILAREKELEMSARSKFQITAVPIISLLILVGSVLFAYPVQALLKSNTVSLTPNRLTVKATAPGGGGGCHSSNTNNVNVNTSTNQTATTGNVNNSNNTNTGNSTSGNASNNSSTNINITITNC